MTCTPSGRPPWSLYETCRMPRPMPSGGMSSPRSASSARGSAALAAAPISPLRCARRVDIGARAPRRSVRLPGVPGAQDLSRHLVGVGAGQRLELLHSTRKAVREIEVTELVRRDAVRAAEPPGLSARRAPAVQEIAVEIELQDAIRERIAGPDESLVVDEVIRDQRALARGPVRRAQRPHVEEIAVGVEHLHALVPAIDDEQPLILADRDAVHRVELVRARVSGVLRR